MTKNASFFVIFFKKVAKKPHEKNYGVSCLTQFMHLDIWIYVNMQPNRWGECVVVAGCRSQESSEDQKKNA